MKNQIINTGIKRQNIYNNLNIIVITFYDNLMEVFIMYVNSQNSATVNIDLEKIEEYIKNVLKLIQDSSKQVINKITNKNKIKEEITEDEVKQHIFLLYQKMDETSVALKKNDLFYDEYFEFREIEDMIKYTLNRNLITISESDLEFILNLVINFFKLVESKVNLNKDSIDKEKFKVKYEEYLSTLDDYKIYFFDRIYDESLDKEAFIKYCNIIME
jgi:hypothetical protein